MDLFSILAFLALLATVVMLVRGIISMTRGGEVDLQASTRLMFRRVEFQGAAAALVIAAILFAGAWVSGPTSPTDRLVIKPSRLISSAARKPPSPVPGRSHNW